MCIWLVPVHMVGRDLNVNSNVDPKEKAILIRLKGRRGSFFKHGKGKHPARKRNMAKVKCYNCGNKGHFARDCSEPKKVNYLFAQVL